MKQQLTLAVAYATGARYLLLDEPMNALDGGPEGLDFYERLVGDALNVLRPGGGVFFEIGDGQGAALRKLFFDAGFDDIRIEPDDAGHDRYASAVLS